jgi:hypothetical protein
MRLNSFSSKQRPYEGGYSYIWRLGRGKGSADFYRITL